MNDRSPVSSRRLFLGGLVVGAAAFAVPGAFAEQLLRTPPLTESAGRRPRLPSSGRAAGMRPDPHSRREPMRPMRTSTAMLLAGGLTLTGGLLIAAPRTAAQPPPGGRGGAGQPGGVEASVARLMAFDTNHDGRLTKEELTDERLQGLFDRADANKDGAVTKEELAAFFQREAAARPAGRNGGPQGGPGGFGGPPAPGQVLPPFLQERLQLTDAQKKQLAYLQKEVDTRLGKILTDAQKKQLQEMRTRGPGGFPPAGPGGPGGFPPPPGGPGGPDGPAAPEES
jgi:EF hand